MALFGAIDRAATGLTTFRTWMDAISDNVANVNTVRPADEAPFRARLVLAEAAGYGEGIGDGVRVRGVELAGDPAGRLVYEPTHPYADQDGYVRYSSVDMGDQMTQMLVAQRAYQANLTVVDRARDAYLAALQIGR